MNTDNYVGIPFVSNGRNRDGADCYGLIKLIYQQELGIELPDWSLPDSDPFTITRMIHSGVASAVEQRFVEEVEDPQDYDIAVFHSGLALHMGIWWRGAILHAGQKTGGAILESEGHLRRTGMDAIRYYRWVGEGE